ncbi:MAG: response regulator transcription factor [Clostridia bacterium]|nr:response regulator transcription factor [Clostridia bacterium]
MIFILEDDKSIRDIVVYALKSSGFEAQGFERPSQLRAEMEKQIPELLLLDIMLPEEDGLCVLKKLRNDPKTSGLPVILLTAKSTEFDTVTGLDAGADDYVAKPFGIMELISRIRAVLRRTDSKSEKTEMINAGDIVIYPSRCEVKVKNEDILLTQKEYKLLVTLAENPGKVFTRDVLLNLVWGYDYDGENRTVDMHIRTLRQKLGDAGDIIETVRGFGYKITEI